MFHNEALESRVDGQNEAEQLYAVVNCGIKMTIPIPGYSAVPAADSGSIKQSFHISQGKYAELLGVTPNISYDELVKRATDELPHSWLSSYKDMSGRKVNVYLLNYWPFTCMFDLIEEKDSQFDSRVVCIFGRSAPTKVHRDDFRLRRLLGSTEKNFGSRKDKGHFIGHSFGGRVLGTEANVFIQRRDLNRGWSADGRLFRRMEGYCATFTGTFCFSRPLYSDDSAYPSFLEFGIIRHDGSIWVECFNNR